MFRTSKKQPLKWIGLRTFGYAAVLWVMTLWLFPVLIVWVEDANGITRLQFPFQALAAVCLFAVSAMVNIWAAVSMVRIGKGTPLPLDCAPVLVAKGIYRFVRNPMAIGGLGMGFAVAVGYGSISIAIYVLTGMAFWNFVVRPVEEKDLNHRFGEPYEIYCKNVKCWWPSFLFREGEEESA